MIYGDDLMSLHLAGKRGDWVVMLSTPWVSITVGHPKRSKKESRKELVRIKRILDEYHMDFGTNLRRLMASISECVISRTRAKDHGRGRGGAVDE